MKRFSIKIVGPAGLGIKSTGVTLAKVFTRQGFNVFGYTEYPSLIRGGHNTYQVDLACQIHPEERSDEGSRGSRTSQPILSASGKCDILISLTGEALEKEINKINSNGLAIIDEGVELNKIKIKTIKAPLIKIAKENGSELMKNTVALGVLLGVLDLPLDELNKILLTEFADKGKVAEENVRAAKGGLEWIKENKVDCDGIPRLTPTKTSGLARDDCGFLYMTGNQATAMGIIASGCQLYVAYPMTPATDILHVLEANQRKTGMVVHQPEDEIAAIHAVLGGSFAGVRSACGTSGGGFALMNEGLSLAGQVELPAVIFEVQRPGPATGNPTWTEQGDLSFVLNAGHGEFPRVVIAPGTPDQCFDLTQHAFNLADRFQVSVIVITDKFLGESGFTTPKDVFDEIDKIDRGKVYLTDKDFNKHLFKRYEVTKDGISWRTVPTVDGGEHHCISAEHNEDGSRCGEHIANSDEHNRLSLSDESSGVRTRMVNKRMQKLVEIQKEIPLPKVYGPKNADITLVTWGSMLGPCTDALEFINNKEPARRSVKGSLGSVGGKATVNLVHFSYIWPLPRGIDKFLNKFNKLVLVENNKTAQLGKLIRQETGIDIKDKLLKYDSRPFWWDELVEALNK